MQVRAFAVDEDTWTILANASREGETGAQTAARIVAENERLRAALESLLAKLATAGHGRPDDRVTKTGWIENEIRAALKA